MANHVYRWASTVPSSLHTIRWTDARTPPSPSRSPARVQQQGWDTNTHTAFADRLCGDSESAATLAREIAQSLAGRSAMINQK